MLKFLMEFFISRLLLFASSAFRLYSDSSSYTFFDFFGEEVSSEASSSLPMMRTNCLCAKSALASLNSNSIFSVALVPNLLFSNICRNSFRLIWSGKFESSPLRAINIFCTVFWFGARPSDIKFFEKSASLICRRSFLSHILNISSAISP